MYIAQDARFRPEYNDVEILQDQKLKQMMLDGGEKNLQDVKQFVYGHADV